MRETLTWVAYGVRAEMKLDDYSEKDGKRVWLENKEIDRLVDVYDDPEKRIALMLAGKAGLRRSEVVSVQKKDFENAADGFLRIWGDYAKRDKYREAPIPNELNHIVAAYTHDFDGEREVVDACGTTVYRWVRRAADELQDETGDEGWGYLDVHDLRRSWGGHLLWDCGCLPTAVMEFGGWEDWDTFADHYMGEMSPKAQQREREKVFGNGEGDDGNVFEPRTSAISGTYG